jgi:hypothetical protein
MNRALRALAGHVRLLLTLAVLAAIAVSGGLLLGAHSEDSKRVADACPLGQRVVNENGAESGTALIGGRVKGGGEAERERERARKQGGKAADRGEAGDYESHFRGKCAPVAHPESSRDLAKFNEYAATRQGADSPQAFSRAVRQRDRLAEAAGSAGVPGTGGTWTATRPTRPRSATASARSAGA